MRKSNVPNYNECVQAAKFIVSDCVKIIEHVCYIFKDNSCILNVKLSCACDYLYVVFKRLSKRAVLDL